jgi:hypothetical protein
MAAGFANRRPTMPAAAPTPSTSPANAPAAAPAIGRAVRHALAAAAVALLLAPLAGTAAAQEGVGLQLRKSVQTVDLGMPVYPQAVQRPSGNEDSNAVTLRAWGGSLGFLLAVGKFDSADAAPRVLAFYRQALAGLGRVVECAAEEGGRTAVRSNTESSAAARSTAPSAATPPAARQADDAPTCDEDRPTKAGAVVLKVGTRRDFRLVHVEPAGPASAGSPSTHFHLVRVRLGNPAPGERP